MKIEREREEETTRYVCMLLRNVQHMEIIPSMYKFRNHLNWKNNTYLWYFMPHIAMRTWMTLDGSVILNNSNNE